MKKKLPLWNGKYRPEDITVEQVAKMNAPEAIKFLAWTHRYRETLEKLSEEQEQ